MKRALKRTAALPLESPENAKPLLHEFLKRERPEFQELSDLLKRLSGISLPMNEKNLTLMACRLAPVLRRYGMQSYRPYLRYLRSDNKSFTQEFVSAMTTNTTDFFRETPHFQKIPDVIDELCKKARKENSSELRIWCAASSTGQEPYTIAMAVNQALQNPLAWTIRLLATDIDLDALKFAARGVYSQKEIKHVRNLYRQKYFEEKKLDGQSWFRVSSLLRDQITFAELNLSQHPYPFQQQFDLIFCRNVLIYFDPDMGRKISQEMARHLKPGGFLFVGHSETGLVKSPELVSQSGAIYRRR